MADAVYHGARTKRLNKATLDAIREVDGGGGRVYNSCKEMFEGILGSNWKGDVNMSVATAEKTKSWDSVGKPATDDVRKRAFFSKELPEEEENKFWDSVTEPVDKDTAKELLSLDL